MPASRRRPKSRTVMCWKGSRHRPCPGCARHHVQATLSCPAQTGARPPMKLAQHRREHREDRPHGSVARKAAGKARCRNASLLSARRSSTNPSALVGGFVDRSSSMAVTGSYWRTPVPPIRIARREHLGQYSSPEEERCSARRACRSPAVSSTVCCSPSDADRLARVAQTADTGQSTSSLRADSHVKPASRFQYGPVMVRPWRSVGHSRPTVNAETASHRHSRKSGFAAGLTAVPYWSALRKSANEARARLNQASAMRGLPPP